MNNCIHNSNHFYNLQPPWHDGFIKWFIVDVSYSSRMFYWDFEKVAAKISKISSFVIGLLGLLVTGILGVVSMYVGDQSKGLFQAYQAWIAFCIIGLIPVRYQTLWNYHNLDILRSLSSLRPPATFLVKEGEGLVTPIWLVGFLLVVDAYAHWLVSFISYIRPRTMN